MVKLATDIRRSSRTRYEGTQCNFDIYSHTLKNVAGRAIVIENDTDWTAYETLTDALNWAKANARECKPGHHKLVQGHHCALCGLAYGDMQSNGEYLR